MKPALLISAFAFLAALGGCAIVPYEPAYGTVVIEGGRDHRHDHHRRHHHRYWR